MSQPLVKVLKFGGSSVGSVESLARVVSIIRGEMTSCRPVVVVSALSGVTNLLVELVESSTPDPIIARLAKRHIEMAEAVLDPHRRYAYLRTVTRMLDELRNRCHGPFNTHREHYILAMGELLSAPLIAGVLSQEGVVAQAVDARKLIATTSHQPHEIGTAEPVERMKYAAAMGPVERMKSAAAMGPVGPVEPLGPADPAEPAEPCVDFAQTRLQIAAWFADLSRFVLPIVTGYIAADEHGNTTVLGRGGSDYTASLIASAVDAAKLDRWTDVDGLYTADPNKVKGAGKFLFLLLEDASSWNESSALGMHAEAFSPVLKACIPVHVRSTRFPQGDGTLILPRLLPGRIERDSRAQLAHANHTLQSASVGLASNTELQPLTV